MNFSGAFQQQWLLPLGLTAFLLAPAVSAKSSIAAEFGLVSPGYNDVAVPGNSGTRFSLTDDLKAENFGNVRIQYGHTFSDEHWLGFLAAPLTLKSQGVIAKDVDFNGTSFSSGSFVRASFEFNSYRLIYRNKLFKSDSIELAVGGALKLRDASIELRSGPLVSEKANIGFVPLLSFRFTSQATERIRLLIEGEALAAPQGRAEDILFAAEYRFNESAALYTGYRVLEGGADNDEVYTFSLFHQLVIGAAWTF